MIIIEETAERDSSLSFSSPSFCLFLFLFRAHSSVSCFSTFWRPYVNCTFVLLIFPCWPYNYYCLSVSSCLTFFVHTQNSHFLVCYCFQSQLTHFGRNQTISEEKVDHFQLRFETLFYSKLHQTWNNKHSRHRLITLVHN